MLNTEFYEYIQILTFLAGPNTIQGIVKSKQDSNPRPSEIFRTSQDQVQQSLNGQEVS